MARRQRRNGVGILSTSLDVPSNRFLLILVASILCYIWGAILLLLSVVVVIPMLSGRSTVIAGALFPVVVLIIALTYFLTGYFIGRRRRLGAWLGITVSTGTALLQFVLHLDMMRISLTPSWLAIDALLFTLVLTNWRRFDRVARRVAA